MSSLKNINMTFTGHTSSYIPSPPPPTSLIAVKKVKQTEQSIESFLYKPKTNTTVAISVKQSLASMFKNIQVKKSCRSCGGFK